MDGIWRGESQACHHPSRRRRITNLSVHQLSSFYLTQIFAILARDQFETQVVKVIPGIIALYKKEKDHLPITHALASVLDCGVRGGGFKGALEPLLPTIMGTIHPLVCVPPDFSNSAVLKNYNELLRCFEIIGRGFSDQLVTFLLGRIEQKDARTRIGALNVIKHIVTRLGV